MKREWQFCLTTLKELKHCDKLFFEQGYGKALGFSDEDFLKYGCHCAPREEVMKCDVITDVKLGDIDCLDQTDDRRLFSAGHMLCRIT